MSTLMDHFRDGGWGMFPTMFAGLALLAVAVRYAVRPEKRLVPLLVTLNVLTVSTGALGFVSGIITTAHYFEVNQPPLAADIPFLGMSESMNNVAFSLLFVCVAAIAMSLGAWKIAREEGPARAA